MGIPTALDGCREKIERAKEQIRYLNGEIAALLNSGAYAVVGQHEFEKRRYVFRTLGPPVPLRIAVLTGEVIHHLWSVFDHIVWALSAGEKAAKPWLISFPVVDRPEKFKEAVARGKVEGVSSAALQVIESFQPYRTPDPGNALIRVLYNLDVTDKHRLLIPTLCAVWPGAEIRIDQPLNADVELILAAPGNVGPFYRAIEDGVEVHWLEYRTTAEPQWEIENEFTRHIAFEQFGAGEREPVIPALVQLCNATAGAINEFAAFF